MKLERITRSMSKKKSINEEINQYIIKNNEKKKKKKEVKELSYNLVNRKGFT